jgi:hypothetical protein
MKSLEQNHTELLLRKKGEKKMKKEITVNLKKPARKSGGDRYESDSGFVIYIPQDISRPAGTPLQTIKVTFEGGK